MFERVSDELIMLQKPKQPLGTTLCGSLGHPAKSGNRDRIESICTY